MGSAEVELKEKDMEHKRVLIHVDLKRRDLAPAVYLRYELKKLGIRVEFCSRLTARWVYNAFKPHVIVSSHCNMFGHQYIAQWAKECEIVVSGTEGAIDHKPLFLADVQGDRRLVDGRKDNTYTRLIKRFYTWGYKQKQWLVEENIFREEDVVVTGCPRYDTMPVKERGGNKNKTIGFLANYSRISLFDNRSILTMIDNERKENGGLYVEGRQLEGGYWCVFATARLMFEMLDRQKEIGGKVIIRPHPNENHEAYKDILTKYGDVVELNTDPDILGFFDQISAMVCMMSTAIVDAIYHKVPVICLEEMLGGQYQEHVDHPVRRKDYLDWSWRPENHEELGELLRKASEGNLPVCPDINKYSSYLSSVYDIPSDGTASFKIAKDIEEVMRNSRKKSLLPKWYARLLFHARIIFRHLQYFFHPKLKNMDKHYHYLWVEQGVESQLLEAYVNKISN